MRSRRGRRASLISVVLLCCCVAFAEDHGTFHSPQGDPIFIPASEAFTPAGEFAPTVPEQWRDYRAARDVSAPCSGSSWGEPDVESSVARDTRQATLENAKAIFAGTVTAVIPGLTNSGPVSVLELGRLRVLKRSAPYSHVGTTLYAIYPYAAFATDAYEFCRKVSPDAAAPAVGDRVIVFAYDDPVDDSHLLVATFERDIIRQPDHGRLQIPRWLSFFAADGDFDGIVGAIARELPATRRGVR